MDEKKINEIKGAEEISDEEIDEAAGGAGQLKVTLRNKPQCAACGKEIKDPADIYCSECKRKFGGSILR
jgi:hypothetical protein